MSIEGPFSDLASWQSECLNRRVPRKGVAWLSWLLPLLGRFGGPLLQNDLPLSLHPSSPFFSLPYAAMSVLPSALGLLVALACLVKKPHGKGVIIHASTGLVLSALCLALALTGTPMPHDIYDPL